MRVRPTNSKTQAKGKWTAGRAAVSKVLNERISYRTEEKKSDENRRRRRRIEKVQEKRRTLEVRKKAEQTTTTTTKMKRCKNEKMKKKEICYLSCMFRSLFQIASKQTHFIRHQSIDNTVFCDEIGSRRQIRRR
jgi:hypothetical protein